MIVARDVIVEAYRQAGIIPDGPGGLDGTRWEIGLSVLNDVVAAMNIQGYIASSMVQLNFVPTQSKLEYTIGEQGSLAEVPDIEAQRPAMLRKAYYQFQETSGPIEIPIVSAADIWSWVPSTLVVGVPRAVAYQSDFPYGKLIFGCQPVVGASFRIVYDKAIPEIVSGDDELALSPEYRPALVYGLAYRVAQRDGRPAETVTAMKTLRQESLELIRNVVMAKTPMSTYLMCARDPGPLFRNIYNRT